MVSLDSYPIPEEGVIGRDLEKEAVLVMPGKGEVKVLNEVGARIWALIDGERSARDIAATLGSEYDVDLDTAQADTLVFLSDLLQRDMITLSDRPAQKRQKL